MRFFARQARWLSALALWAAACASAPVSPTARGGPSDSGRFVRLTIVGTNDLHGWVQPHPRSIPGAPPILGGVDAFAGYLKILREKRPGDVLLLDAGDLFQGTLVDGVTEGASTVRAYNALGYDAVAVGNHEFDYGPVGPDVVAVHPGEDPLGNLKARMKQARFAFLTANILDQKTGEPPPWPARQTMLVRRGGLVVGLIGLTTPDTPEVTLAQNVAGLAFEPLAATAIDQAKKLRAQGAQVIVVLAHAGGSCRPGGDPRDENSCDLSGEIFRMVEAIPPGTVDAVVAGHTHQYIANFVHGVPVIQSGSHGVAFGVIGLWFDRKARHVDQQRTRIWQPVPICREVFASTHDCRHEAAGPLVPATFLGEVVQPSRKVEAALRPDLRRVVRLKNERLGPSLDSPFTRSLWKESSLGDYVADVMRESVPGTQVAFTNSGGLRADLTPGPVTYGEVYDALPFQNRLVVLHATGRELLAFFEHGVRGEHGVLQTSGVRLRVAAPCSGKPAHVVSAVLADGTPLEPDRTYQAVTNDFIASGGDGFGVVLRDIDRDHIVVRNDLPSLRDAVVASLRAHPEMRGPRGGQPRLKFVSTCPSPAAVSDGMTSAAAGP